MSGAAPERGMCTYHICRAGRVDAPPPARYPSGVTAGSKPLPPLPESFRELFWEVDFRPDLSQTHPEYVVARLLEHGGDAAVSWVLRHVAPERLVDVVRTSRSLRRTTAHCWANYLGIPLEEIECLKTPSLLPSSSFA